MTINLTNKTIQHAEIKEPDKADSTATKKQKLDDDEEVLDQMLHLLRLVFTRHKHKHKHKHSTSKS